MAKFELKVPPGLKPDGSPLDAVEYVEIVVGPSEIVSRAATDEDRNKYKTDYAAFKAGEGSASPVENPGPVYRPEPDGPGAPVGSDAEFVAETPDPTYYPGTTVKRTP